MLVVRDDPVSVEAELAAGDIACPDCGTPLAPWGYSCEREVRTLDATRLLRPRRARCGRCDATHVLEPATTVAWHRDTAEVIGSAWLASVNGAGHRAIAAQLDRPESTVRRWLRDLARGAENLRVAATEWLYRLDPLASGPEPAGSGLADALEVVGLAVSAALRRFGPSSVSPWAVAVGMSGGLLAGPAP